MKYISFHRFQCRISDQLPNQEIRAPHTSHEERRHYRRTLTRLVQKAGRLPPVLYLRHIQPLGRLDSGSYADVYKGVYKGTEDVVIKCSQALKTMPRDPKVKAVRSAIPDS